MWHVSTSRSAPCDTACSSAPAAVHQACEQSWTGFGRALQLADVSATVTLNLRIEFADFGATFTPGDHQGPALTAMLDQLLSWSNALAHTRNSAAPALS